ncbi:hypothetical protein [Tunicatimonas pelagia]|uniref:hypothetical protein n=1 Tax=Tunicatimonas pelagia TaxID=931531 RepID=UPI002666CDF5|nr:hypothetical protein [Tunicatimonas pelagia]WKN42002.1 hypothetical protein P0M28_23450 [Tunicatimonas pelagia]
MPIPSRVLLRNTPENVVATAFSSTASCQQLLSHTSVTKMQPPYTIWLTQIEQIHRFVYHIPNLAWELMDYATEPLSLIYKQAKPLFTNEAAPREVCIRLIAEPFLRKQLTGQHAYLAVALERIKDEFPITDWVDQEIDMSRVLKGTRPVRVMRIYDNGEFSFVP